jgi:predicted NUDIX family NTP pyrophosphohydrolase
VPRVSAGLLLYRRGAGVLEVFLVHPGGPFWMKKDLGAWSIPKGEFAPDDDALEAARRELREETGFEVEGPFTALAPVKQPGGKVVHAWAVEADVDPARLASNTFTIEWPPKSGRQQAFPEIDRAAWFPIEEARRRILRGQTALLDNLVLVTRNP